MNSREASAYNRIQKFSSQRRPGQKNVRDSYRPVIIALILVAVLALIFYCTGGFGGHSEAPDEDVLRSGISANVDRLVSLEQQQVSEIARAEETTESTEGVAEDAAEVKLDLDELQYALLQHYGEYDYNAEYFRGWFSDSAIVGDSIAEAIKEFGWVNDINVQSEIGINVYGSENVIAGTEALAPSTIFLTFSANDISSYYDYIDSFIADYTAVIVRLQNSIPWAEIYVQAILPCDPDYLEELSYYEYRDEYNIRLQQMCEELGVHYYDVSFICEAHPDIYGEDGYHPTWPFYCLWLNYMAEVAGLADH